MQCGRSRFVITSNVSCNAVWVDLDIPLIFLLFLMWCSVWGAWLSVPFYFWCDAVLDDPDWLNLFISNVMQFGRILIGYSLFISDVMQCGSILIGCSFLFLMWCSVGGSWLAIPFLFLMWCSVGVFWLVFPFYLWCDAVWEDPYWLCLFVSNVMQCGRILIGCSFLFLMWCSVGGSWLAIPFCF